MTAVQPDVIPQALQDWRPSCALGEGWGITINNEREAYHSPPCDREAKLAVILHNRCNTTVSCLDCYTALYKEAIANNPSGNGIFSCIKCGFRSPALDDILRAERL